MISRKEVVKPSLLKWWLMLLLLMWKESYMVLNHPSYIHRYNADFGRVSLDMAQFGALLAVHVGILIVFPKLSELVVSMSTTFISRLTITVTGVTEPRKSTSPPRQAGSLPMCR